MTKSEVIKGLSIIVAFFLGVLFGGGYLQQLATKGCSISENILALVGFPGALFMLWRQK
jgi:uncharacterized membrane protein required for colicin V production